MVVIQKKIEFYYPNLIANILVILSALGVSVYANVRNIFFLLLLVVFLVFRKKIDLNKPVWPTYFLTLLNAYFLMDSFFFHNPSSAFLFKDFIYILLFDLFLRLKLKHSKSVFYLTIFFSILTLFLNLTYRRDMIGSFSAAFGVPRVLNISMITLSLFLLFNYVKVYHHIFILFCTLITFSAASYLIYLIYLIKKIPFLFILTAIAFISTFNFENNELYNIVKFQKEKSLENKINDKDARVNFTGEYEVAEVLSIELFHNAGLVFAIVVTLFLAYYIFVVSGSIMFTIFSLILISSNPTPLILICIIGSFLKLSNYENRKHHSAGDPRRQTDSIPAFS